MNYLKNKLQSHVGTIIIILSLLINLALVLCVFSSLEAAPVTNTNKDSNTLYRLYNSDSIFIEFIYKSITEFKQPILGWNIGTFTGFFPVLLIYFLLMLIIKDFLIVHLLVALIQYFSILIILFFIYKQLFKVKVYLAYSISIMSFTFFAAFALINPISSEKDLANDLLFNLFQPYHTGAFINCLLSILLTIYYFKTQLIKYLFLLGTISLLGCFSDRMFLVMYILPALFCSFILIFIIDKRIVFRFILAVFLGCALGLYLYELGVAYHWYSISESGNMLYSNILPSINYMLVHYKSLLFDNGYMKYILITTILVTFTITIILCFEIFYTKNRDLLHIVYLSLVLGFTIIVFFAPALNGTYYADFCIRYNIYSVYFSVLQIGYILYYFKDIIHFKYLYICIICVFLLVLSAYSVQQLRIHNPIIGIERIKNYYPDIAASTDSLAIKYSIKNGIGDPWDAKFLTMFSKQNVQIYSVYGNLALYHHANNSNSFFRTNKFDYTPPVFNFIVLNIIQDTSAIYQTFGSNTKKVQFGSLTFILTPDFIYDQNHKPKILNDPPIISYKCN